MTKEELYQRLLQMSREKERCRFMYKVGSNEEMVMLRNLSKERKIYLGPIVGPGAPAEPIEIQIPEE